MSDKNEDRVEYLLDQLESAKSDEDVAVIEKKLAVLKAAEQES